MGATGSSKNSMEETFSNLTHVRKMGQSKALYRSPQSDQLYITVEHTFASSDQLQLLQSELRKKSSVNHPHYLSPVESFTMTNSNICSKQHKLIQLFPYESHSLWQEVQNRMMHGKSFSSREVWSILCSSVLAMGHLSRNEVVHYTLSPHDIVLNNEGNVKILPVQLSEYPFDYSIRRQYYYSPEMMKAMKCTSQLILTNKSGVFTLALTILHLINLKPMSFLYDFDQMTIDHQTLQKCVQMILDDDIRHILKKMVKVAAYDRITFTELEEMLYGILEGNNTESEQIDKLQDSICRIGNDFDVTLAFDKQNLSHFGTAVENGMVPMCAMEKDCEDEPSSRNYQSIGIDYQKIDEDCSQKFSQSECSENYLRSNNILTDRSNFSNSKMCSVKIHEEKSTGIFPISQLSSQDWDNSSRTYGPYYVTEEYNRGRYEGYKSNGMRHGFGTFYYQEGGKYTGEWVMNKMQGRGALYYTGGNIAYQGEWKKDQLHGYGVLYNESPKYINESFPCENMNKIDYYWVKYSGDFKEDLKHGPGTLYLTNGENYMGEFKSDLPDGPGAFTNIKGQLVQGTWNKGVYEHGMN